MSDRRARGDEGVREATGSRAQVSELGRFLVVGLSAVGTDFLVYMLASRVIAPAPAKGLSFVAGAALSFLLNRAFVFRAKQHGNVTRQAGAFTVLYATTLLLNLSVNAAGLWVGLPKAMAWLFATGTSTVANFLGMKFLVFAATGRRAEPGSREDPSPRTKESES